MTNAKTEKAEPEMSTVQQGGFNQFGGNRQNQQTQIRARMTIGFTTAPNTRSRVAMQLETRLAKIPQIKTPVPIRVSVLDGRVAVLRGSVAKASDRKLIERLAMLEPGISKVKNELTVASPTAARKQPALRNFPSLAGFNN